MSPLPVPALTRRRDGRKVENPRRAGSPERDQPTSLLPRDPRTRTDVDVTPCRVEGEAPRIKARARTERENALEGETSGRHRRARPQGRAQNELAAGTKP